MSLRAMKLGCIREKSLFANHNGLKKPCFKAVPYQGTHNVFPLICTNFAIKDGEDTPSRQKKK